MDGKYLIWTSYEHIALQFPLKFIKRVGFQKISSLPASLPYFIFKMYYTIFKTLKKR